MCEAAGTHALGHQSVCHLADVVLVNSAPPLPDALLRHRMIQRIGWEFPRWQLLVDVCVAIRMTMVRTHRPAAGQQLALVNHDASAATTLSAVPGSSRPHTRIR